MIVVVSDTSPVRALLSVQRLELLRSLFDAVYVPPAVVRELERAGCWDAASPFLTLRSPTDPTIAIELSATLDEGESQAIALAKEIHPDFLLIDEAAGRLIGRQLGIQTMGFLGVLLRAKRLGHLNRIMPLVDFVIKDINFFVSPRMYSEIKDLAGE